MPHTAHIAFPALAAPRGERRARPTCRPARRYASATAARLIARPATITPTCPVPSFPRHTAATEPVAISTGDSSCVSTRLLGRLRLHHAVRPALGQRRDLRPPGPGPRLGLRLPDPALPSRPRRTAADRHPRRPLAAGARPAPAHGRQRPADDRRLLDLLPAGAGPRHHPRGAGDPARRATDPHPDAAGTALRRPAPGRSRAGARRPGAGGVAEHRPGTVLPGRHRLRTRSVAMHDPRRHRAEGPEPVAAAGAAVAVRGQPAAVRVVPAVPAHRGGLVAGLPGALAVAPGHRSSRWWRSCCCTD